MKWSSLSSLFVKVQSTQIHIIKLNSKDQTSVISQILTLSRSKIRKTTSKLVVREIILIRFYVIQRLFARLQPVAN